MINLQNRKFCIEFKKPTKPSKTDMIKRYEPGRNPNSLANLKKTAGPGRPKMTPEEKTIKKAIREYMKEYLENGEAVKDFQRIRTRKPDVALKVIFPRYCGYTKGLGRILNLGGVRNGRT